jgi:predicted site-specific integrase-resolvase
MQPRAGEISARRAARMLGIHVRTVRAWCRAGRLETARIDMTGHYWVLRQEIEALMRAAEAAAFERVRAYRAKRSG